MESQPQNPEFKNLKTFTHVNIACFYDISRFFLANIFSNNAKQSLYASN